MRCITLVATLLMLSACHWEFAHVEDPPPQIILKSLEILKVEVTLHQIAEPIDCGADFGEMWANTEALMSYQTDDSSHFFVWGNPCHPEAWGLTVKGSSFSSIGEPPFDDSASTLIHEFFHQLGWCHCHEVQEGEVCI